MRWTWKGSYDETQPLRPTIDSALHDVVHRGVMRVALLLHVPYRKAARVVEKLAHVRPGTVQRLETGSPPPPGARAYEVHAAIERMESRSVFMRIRRKLRRRPSCRADARARDNAEGGDSLRQPLTTSARACTFG